MQGHAPDDGAGRRMARFSPDTAREICERTGSAAFVEGSIARLGQSIRAGPAGPENCRNGDVLDEETGASGEKGRCTRGFGQHGDPFWPPKN